MVLGVDAAPDAASLAAMLGEQEADAEDDFQGFGFSGKEGADVPTGQEAGRTLAQSLFQQYDLDGASVLRRDTVSLALAQSDLDSISQLSHLRFAIAGVIFTIAGNGSLDSAEVQQFAAKIGLKLTMAEAEEAVNEMELTEKKDGVVEFDEFWHWFMCVSAQTPSTNPKRVHL